MRRHRLALVLLVAALLLGGVAPRAPGAAAAGSAHTTTLLLDGRVLIIGLNRSVLYDPASGTSTETGAPAHVVGYGHTTTLLADGQVLLTGGFTGARGGAALARTERYDPATGRWTPVAPMAVGRSGHTATRLPDGRVLVVGGTEDGSAEVYNPTTDTWTPTGSMAVARPGTPLAVHEATLLRGGPVLVTGGATSERYDPASERWTTVAPMRLARLRHTATPLPDGRVLVAGGTTSSGDTASVELYDPTTDHWADAAALNAPRSGHTATLLPDGRVLVAGGGPGGSSIAATAEAYDPAANCWTLTVPLATGRVGHAATLLPDGRVLLVGGDAGLGTTEAYSDVVPTHCFAETGQCLRERFLEHWLAHGGLAINGYPLSPERRELLEDGREYTVQYFERVRLEHHPENAPPHDVLLGHFGRRVLREAYQVDRSAYVAAVAPVAPQPGLRYFVETGHHISPRFRDYWEAHGGLAQFGYPLTEERFDTLEDGVGYRTQYFERARFEYHPENEGTPYVVLLGQFGRRMLAENALLIGELGAFYKVNERVQVQLGAPTSAVVQSPGATQPFEGGRMLYATRAPSQDLIRGGHMCFPTACPGAAPAAIPPVMLSASAQPASEEFEPTIYVLCGDIAGGQTDRRFFRDTWAADQPVGGGPGPRPGLYEPKRGFGKVWRERQLAQARCAAYADAPLGYATTPDETTLPITVQYFAGGALLLSDTPEGRFVYVIWVGYFSISGTPGGYYERYSLPGR